MNIQGFSVTANLHVLPLVRLDVETENAWLKGLGWVVHNYHSMTMEFMLDFKK